MGDGIGRVTVSEMRLARATARCLDWAGWGRKVGQTAMTWGMAHCTDREGLRQDFGTAMGSSGKDSVVKRMGANGARMTGQMWTMFGQAGDVSAAAQHNEADVNVLWDIQRRSSLLL